MKIKRNYYQNFVYFLKYRKCERTKNSYNYGINKIKNGMK